MPTMTLIALLNPGRTPFRVTGIAAVIVAASLLLVADTGAQTPTAATLYERAQAQERDALSVTPPAPNALRRIALSYEALVRRFWTSGYADNALWQAAALMERSFELTGEARDREAAVRYFTWLAREYPTSTLAKQAGPRADALKAAAAAPAARPTSRPVPSGSASPASPQSSAVAVRDISRTAIPRGDRITIELSSEVSYTGDRVANPDRVFFDFANATAAAHLADRARSIQSPLIRTVRVGTPVRGVTRVVLELDGAPRFSAFPLYQPFRLVVDIESTAPTDVPPAPGASPAGTDAPGRAAAAPPTSTAPATSAPAPASTDAPPPATSPPAASTPAPVVAPAGSASVPLPQPAPPASTQRGDYSLARQLGLRVSRIVIDPGHGGHDPGAQANGLTEAELVLDVALRLEKLLVQQPGVEVVLTRRTNEFVPLEERTAIANREPADLFLSIHANAHRLPATRGIETYFLNFAANPEAEAVAARENATSLQAMGTLPSIVKAIALNNKLAESREFASVLQTQLVRRLRAHTPATKDLGVKQAPFVVLIGAQMPSVLTEIGFLTNRAEAALMKQPAYRQQIAQALRDAIVRYQDSLKKVTTVVSQEPRQ